MEFATGSSQTHNYRGDRYGLHRKNKNIQLLYDRVHVAPSKLQDLFMNILNCLLL